MQGFGSTSVAPGPKPNPSGNAGIAMGFLSMRGSLRAAQAHTQSNSVHKMWRKKYYSDIGPSLFTVPWLGWRERVAQSGWNTAVSRKYTLDFHLNEPADPCFHPNQYGCGNWAQRRFNSALEVLRREAFQRVVTGMSMSTQALIRNQNLSQCASRTNTSWIAFSDSKEREELGEEKKDDGKSRPLVSNTRCSGMARRTRRAQQPCTHEIMLLGGHALNSSALDELLVDTDDAGDGASRDWADGLELCRLSPASFYRNPVRSFRTMKVVVANTCSTRVW